MAADTSDLSRLTTFQHHIDDMRNLVMCKICLKPLYEPFILACGHTYCYGCLRSWFSGLDSRKRKKNCPDCRAEVNLVPSPNYILRDLVHMFINRAELLPEDETVEEHIAAKVAEADLLAGDKDGDGIFQGLFKTKGFRIPGYGPLYDTSDNVYRCPNCYHELEHGMCLQCGYEVHEDDDYPDISDEDEEDSMMGDESGGSSVSHSSGYDGAHGLPHHFYGDRTLARIIDRSMDSDAYSDLEYEGPYSYVAEVDDDEMDRFIDDNDEDEPDEVDEDDMEGPRSRPASRSRGRRYLIPDDDDAENEETEGSQWSNDDDDNEEEEEEEGEENQPSSWSARRSANQSYLSDDEENEIHRDEDSSQDQQTIYDESDEESQNSTPVAMPLPPRRRPIVISDDEDEEDEGGEDESPVNGRHQGVDIETDENNESSGSDDTTIPPQSSANRRQRLDNHRKRRRTPDDWRTIARGRGERPGSRRESRSTNHEIRPIRPGSHYLSVPS